MIAVCVLCNHNLKYTFMVTHLALKYELKSLITTLFLNNCSFYVFENCG